MKHSIHIFKQTSILMLVLTINIAGQVDIGRISKIADNKTLQLSGEIKNINICPVNSKLISFESFENGEKASLHWMSTEDPSSLHTINIIPEDNEYDEEIVTRDINWSPVKINNKIWMLFTCIKDNNEDIYLGNTKDDFFARITNSKASDRKPRWSPDGKYILYVSTVEDEKGNSDIKVIFNITSVINDFDEWIKENEVKRKRTEVVFEKAASLMRESPLVNSSFQENDPDWSPDGKYVVYTSEVNKGGRRNQDIFLFNFGKFLSGEKVVSQFLTNTISENETKPKWSFDGNKIAFYKIPAEDSEDEIGIAELHYLTFSDDFYSISSTLAAEKVKKGIQELPQWGDDSKTLFFISEDGSKRSIKYVNTEGFQKNNKLKTEVLIKDSLGIAYSEIILSKTSKFSRAAVLSYNGQDYTISTMPLLIEGQELVQEDVFNISERPKWSIGIDMLWDQYQGKADAGDIFNVEAGNAVSIEYFFDQTKIPLNLSAKLSGGYSHFKNNVTNIRPMTRIELSAIVGYDFKLSSMKASLLGEIGVGIGNVTIWKGLFLIGTGIALHPFDNIRIIPALKFRSYNGNLDGREEEYKDKDGLLSYQLGLNYMFNLKDLKIL